MGEVIEKLHTPRNLHKFYCDICKEEIGNSAEYEDGFYAKIGNVEKSAMVYDIDKHYDTKRFELKKYLCRKCTEKLNESMEDVFNMLIKLGFEYIES